jgi:hypothetical protein
MYLLCVIYDFYIFMTCMLNFTSQAPAVRRHQTNTQKNIFRGRHLVVSRNRNVTATEGAYFSSSCYHITLRNGISRHVCETLDCRCGNTGSYHCVLRKTGGVNDYETS